MTVKLAIARSALFIAACGLVMMKTVLAGESGANLEIPFEKYSLDNGLEVIVHEDHKLPLVAVSVWYHVAAVNEVQGKTGFAHLFEHMMFQGSKHVADDVHIQTLETIGASEINGTTDFDRTNYFETVPANHLETVLWLESDRMGFLLDALTQEKLDNQRDVVKNERRQTTENRPYGIAEEKLWQALFPEPHPYYGAIIGSMADLSAAGLDDVRQFFNRYYSPANATLTIAGDLDPAEVRRLVDKYFGSLKKSEKPPPVDVAPVSIEGKISIEHPEKIAELTKVKMVWHSPKYYAEGDAAADVLGSVLSDGKSSRLYQRLVRELEIAQSVDASQHSMGEQSVFAIDVIGRRGIEASRLAAAVDAVLGEIRSGELDVKEVQRAVNKFETRFFVGLQRLGGSGGRAERLQGYNHFVRDPGFLQKDLSRYYGVDKDAVVRFAGEVLTDAKRAVLFAVPIGQEKPTKSGSEKEDSR